MKKNIPSQKIVSVAAFFILIFFMFGLTPTVQYFRKIKLYNKFVSGIVSAKIYGTGIYGFEYYISDESYIDVYYFFEEPSDNNLAIGDSIYKAPNSFRLYIYKKDEQGKYVFDRMEMKNDDSVSPYSSL